MTTFIILLRAIGPATHKLMSMALWREAAAAAGFENPQTYVATGNMIAESDLKPAEAARKMDDIIIGLGLAAANTAVVRSARQIGQLLAANPFPEASLERPQAVGVHCFARARPDFGWVADYAGPESIAVVGTHLIVDYGSHETTSRLPAIIEKKSGIATARNWNTLRGLAERAGARAKQD